LGCDLDVLKSQLFQIKQIGDIRKHLDLFQSGIKQGIIPEILSTFLRSHATCSYRFHALMHYVAADMPREIIDGIIDSKAMLSVCDPILQIRDYTIIAESAKISVEILNGWVITGHLPLVKCAEYYHVGIPLKMITCLATNNLWKVYDDLLRWGMNQQNCIDFYKSISSIPSVFNYDDLFGKICNVFLRLKPFSPRMINDFMNRVIMGQVTFSEDRTSRHPYYSSVEYSAMSAWKQHLEMSV
jgi:hypothetical protein